MVSPERNYACIGCTSANRFTDVICSAELSWCALTLYFLIHEANRVGFKPSRSAELFLIFGIRLNLILITFATN